MSNDEFEKMFNGDEFDHVFYETLATTLVPLYRAFKKEGLSGHEAAILAATFATQLFSSNDVGENSGS